MLYDFLESRLEQVRRRVGDALDAPGPLPVAGAASVEEEVIGEFLDELMQRLRRVTAAGATDRTGDRLAAKHAVHRRAAGVAAATLVRNYGAVCSAIATIAAEEGNPIAPAELHCMNACLDEAAAGALAEYARRGDADCDDQERTAAEYRRHLAHEVRDTLGAAVFAFAAMKRGGFRVDSRAGKVLERALDRMRQLADLSLSDEKLLGDMPLHVVRFPLALLLAEVASFSAPRAADRRLKLLTEASDERNLEGDRQLLVAALAVLANNAIAYSPPGGRVWLRGRVDAHRVVVEVEDESVALSSREEEARLRPFVHGASRRTGPGSGPAIARRAIAAHGGSVWLRRVPSRGSMFVVELPQPLDRRAPSSKENPAR
jgi:signal transduction histidine kinase